MLLTEEQMRAVELTPRLFELPDCPKCQTEVVTIRVADTTHTERVYSKMVPLSRLEEREYLTHGFTVILFDRWVCVRCGYAVW